MTALQDFVDEIEAQLRRAQRQGRAHHEINAGELHRTLGGYPSSDSSHRMPICCSAIRKLVDRQRDAIVFAPPSGDGAAFTVRFGLPR